MSEFVFNLPDLGDGISEAEVLKWHAAPGDSIDEHMPLLEVQTDKAVVDLPAPVSGTVLSHGSSVGDIVQVGDLIALLDLGDGDIPDESVVTDQVDSSSNGQGRAEALDSGGDSNRPTSNAGRPSKRPRPLAAPSVRAVARKLGLDLKEITGSGPNGRILKEDLEAASGRIVPAVVVAAAGSDETIEAAGKTPQAARHEPLRGLRRTIARTMTETARSTPCVTAMCEVDVTELTKQLKALQEIATNRGSRLTWTSIFALATVQAIREFPDLNAWLDMDNEEVTYHSDVHLGIATDTEGGLLVPVVRDASAMTLLGLAAEISRVSELARSGKATIDVLRGSTITLTNYGSVGGWYGTPIVNRPEVAIVGFGAVEDRPAVVGDEIVKRTMVALSTTVDHRFIDGATNAAFGAHLKSRLENPIPMILGDREW